MDNCEVLESFSGPNMHGTRGHKIELPHDIALSYERYGMVKILGPVHSPVAFETAKAAKEDTENTKIETTIKPKKNIKK